MNGTDKRFDAALDLVQWLDQRIGAQVAHQLEQRLAQEREYWRCHVVDLIAAERARLGALIEEQCRKLIDWVEADHKKSGCSPPQACAALTMTVSRRLRRTN